MKTRQTKREEAIDRQLARNKRTNAQQLALLTKRPGNAARERDRLT